MDWTTTGYPPKHYEELGSAKRYAFKALAVTGSFMLIALAVVLYYGIHPGVAAFAIAIFVLFGVIGGLGWVYDSTRYVRVMLYFGRALGDIDTFLAGYTLARYLGQLDALATAHGAEPISAFGFADDLRGETLVWHDANEGLQCVRTLRQAIEGQPIANDVRSEIERDLLAWEHALNKASEQDVKFCVLLMHGNSTSGHEWDVRKGSAF